jgi:hypothetical protein
MHLCLGKYEKDVSFTKAGHYFNLVNLFYTRNYLNAQDKGIQLKYIAHNIIGMGFQIVPVKKGSDGDLCTPVECQHGLEWCEKQCRCVHPSVCH